MASKTHIVHDPTGPDIEFEGELLAEEQAEDVGNVKVYRTGSGKFVAEQRRNAFRGRPSLHKVGVFEELEALADWLGHSVGAKRVLERIGHPTRRRID